MTLGTQTLAKKICLHRESAPVAIINVEERNFLDKTEKLVGTDSKWEVHVAQ